MKVVSIHKVSSNAKILRAGESPEDMDVVTLEMISNHIFEKGIDEALFDKTEIDFINAIERFKTDTQAWKQAVLQYAKDANYDAIWHCDEEVVLLNLSVEVLNHGQF